MLWLSSAQAKLSDEKQITAKITVATVKEVPMVLMFLMFDFFSLNNYFSETPTIEFFNR